MRTIALILFLISSLYLSYKIYNRFSVTAKNNSIVFQNKTINLGQVRNDTLYRLIVLVDNVSSKKESYSLTSTCGCTVVEKSENRSINPYSTDSIVIALNTYGKNDYFETFLFLTNRKSTIADTLIIKGFAK